MTSYGEPAQTTAQRTPAFLLACVVVVITLVVLGNQLLERSPSGDRAPHAAIHALRKHHRAARRGADAPAIPSSPPRDPERVFAREQGGALGEADGAVPENTTVFDNGVPAVANLDPSLLSAVRQAATAAAADGVEFVVDSGWRSPAYQQHLLDEAVSKYGSLEEAERWVATPSTSAHVDGKAIDIGHPNAAAWLSEHGAQYGLCRVYANEPWHFELRREAIDHGCPVMYADPAHDPRMQR